MLNNKLDEVAYEISEINNLWKDVVKHLKKDLAYIWYPEVRKDFEKIEGDLERIEFVLKQFYHYYAKPGAFGVEYNREFSDVVNLIKNLNKIKNVPKFVRKIHRELVLIIRDVEDLKEDQDVFNQIADWLSHDDIRTAAGERIRLSARVTAPLQQVRHLLLSFTEDLIDAESVVPYFRDYLKFSLNDKAYEELERYAKGAQQKHQERVNIVLKKSDQELIAAFNRLKQKIKIYLDSS